MSPNEKVGIVARRVGESKRPDENGEGNLAMNLIKNGNRRLRMGTLLLRPTSRT